MRKSLLKSIVAVAVVGATMAITSVAAMAATYELNASSLSAGDITAETKAGTDNFFTLLATDAKNDDGKYTQHFTVEANNKTGPITETKYTGRLKSNGNGSEDFRCIKFTVESAANVTIEGMSSKSGTTRSAELYKADGTSVGSLSNDGKAIGGQTFEVAAGEYYITQTNGAFNYYGIVVETKDSGDTLTAGAFDNTAGTGKVVVVAGEATTAPSVYVVAVVSKTDLTKGDTLTVKFNDQNKTTVETDTVYQSVDGVDTANFGGDYYYAVNVTGVSSDADVAALKAFTFDIA